MEKLQNFSNKKYACVSKGIKQNVRVGCEWKFCKFAIFLEVTPFWENGCISLSFGTRTT